MCHSLFLHKSELGDRRPVEACENGDTICADCFNECRKSLDAKCPTCNGELLSSLVENSVLMQLIESYANATEIPITEMKEMDKKPFAREGNNKFHNAKWKKYSVIIKIVKLDNEKQKRENTYEINLLIGLNHPNVVRLFGVTKVNTHFGIVMEKAPHGSLDTLIANIEEEKRANIALGMVSGLEYIHSRKVVHRDVRPTTILMFGPKTDIVPKIGDFSTSKVIQGVTALTQVGDDFYNAPEVCFNLKYGFTADVFSLAITLFELFNGQLFKAAPTEIKRIIFAVKAGRVGKIPDNSPVPKDLRGIIERGWDKNPENRPTLSDYKSALKPMIPKPTVAVASLRTRRVSMMLQVEEMATVNIPVPAQAMSWSDSCERLNSKQLREEMVNDIKTKSTQARLINDSVLRAMSVVPRHLFVEKRKLAQSNQQAVVTAAYAFNKPVPATMNANESSAEITGTLLSMTEIIQGQSVLLVGIKGGYMEALIAQLVGMNGSVESVSASAHALSICRERITPNCLLTDIIMWNKVADIKDSGSIAEEFKSQEKLFHTVIFGCALEKFPSELTEAESGILYGEGNVSLLAPVKDSDGVVRYQLYVRRDNEAAELRAITDFESVLEDAY